MIHRHHARYYLAASVVLALSASASRRWSLGLLTTVAPVARVAAAIEPDAGAEREAGAKRKAIATGLRLREEALSRIRGEAVLRQFLSAWFYRVYGPPAPQGQLQRPELGDRQMAAIRFSMEDAKLRFEAQCLLFAGGLYSWFPGGGPPSAIRSPHCVGDLYYHEVCDGEYDYQARHVDPWPTWMRTPSDSKTALATRHHIQGWLAIRPVNDRLSDVIVDPRARLMAIEWVEAEGHKCLSVRLGWDRQDHVAGLRCLIAPALAYSPVRMELLTASTGIPGFGHRDVFVWRDFVQVGETWVPQQYEMDHYDYGRKPREGGEPVNGWAFKDRVELRKLHVGQPVSFGLLDSPAPIGARFMSMGFEDISTGEWAALAAEAEELWRQRELLKKSALPLANPDYEKPWTADDVADIRREFGLTQ